MPHPPHTQELEEGRERMEAEAGGNVAALEIGGTLSEGRTEALFSSSCIGDCKGSDDSEGRGVAQREQTERFGEFNRVHPTQTQTLLRTGRREIEHFVQTEHSNKFEVPHPLQTQELEEARGGCVEIDGSIVGESGRDSDDIDTLPDCVDCKGSDELEGHGVEQREQTKRLGEFKRVHPMQVHNSLGVSNDRVVITLLRDLPHALQSKSPSLFVNPQEGHPTDFTDVEMIGGPCMWTGCCTGCCCCSCRSLCCC